MLPEETISAIKRVYADLKSYRATAKYFKISKDTVRRYVHGLHKKDPKKPGPKGKLDRHMELRIKKLVRKVASDGKRVTASMIKEELELDLSLACISSYLRRMGFYWDVFEKNLPLTNEHEKRRVEFAEQWMANSMDYKKLVFSDEKRFSFDGPDSLMSWQDTSTRNMNYKRRNQQVRRQQGGGSVMIIGYITYEGEFSMKILHGKYRSMDYLNDVHEFISWLAFKYGVGEKIWQQDNCSVHTAAIIQNYFKEWEIQTLEWPSRSPDLNHIENLWSKMSQLIYDGTRYNTKNQLIKAIEEAAVKINESHKDYIKSLFDSFPRRLTKIIASKGKRLKY